MFCLLVVWCSFTCGFNWTWTASSDSVMRGKHCHILQKSNVCFFLLVTKDIECEWLRVNLGVVAAVSQVLGCWQGWPNPPCSLYFLVVSQEFWRMILSLCKSLFYFFHRLDEETFFCHICSPSAVNEILTVGFQEKYGDLWRRFLFFC